MKAPEQYVKSFHNHRIAIIKYFSKFEGKDQCTFIVPLSKVACLQSAI